MISFALICFAWCLIGFAGVLNCKEDRVNYEMLIFWGFALLLPTLANFFGIL